MALLNQKNGGGKPPQPPWQDIWSKVVGTSAALPTTELQQQQQQQQGDAVLRRLNMTSSIEPRPFSIEPSAIWSVLGTSIPVCLLFLLYMHMFA